MYVTLYLPNPVTFTYPTKGGPYPWLDSVGTRRSKVRAGHLPGIGATETPTLDFTLANLRNQTSTLIDIPIRQRCDVFNEDGSIFFSGFIASMIYSPLTLTIDA